MSHPPSRHAGLRIGIALLALGLTLSGNVRAESGEESGNLQFYFGVGGGGSPMALDKQDFSLNGNYVNGAPGTTSVKQDDSFSESFKGFVGIRLFKYVGLEAGYSHFGSIGYTAKGLGTDVFGNFNHEFTDRGDYSAEMSYVAALLTIPEGDHGAYFHLKAGVAQVKVELRETITREFFSGATSEEIYTSTVSQSRQLFGVGYTMPSGGKGNQLRVEWEYLGDIGNAYRFNSKDGTGRANVSMITLSYMIAF